MQSKFPAHVTAVLAELLPQIQATLGDTLIGVYLYGSLVVGDFDDDISDIDLLAVTVRDLNPTEFTALEAMHYAVIARHPRWNDRIEIVYLSLDALQTFRTQHSQIAVISPGEPFNLKDAGTDWLMNWYHVRETGVTLLGPLPDEIIPPISKAEFLACVKTHVANWLDWMGDIPSRPYQSYSILMLCRAYYTLTHGEHVSKRRAAEWAQRQLPEWADLIQNALVWRRQALTEKDVDPAATLPETRHFVAYITNRILNGLLG